jgi:hypothetical protein
MIKLVFPLALVLLVLAPSLYADWPVSAFKILESGAEQVDGIRQDGARDIDGAIELRRFFLEPEKFDYLRENELFLIDARRLITDSEIFSTDESGFFHIEDTYGKAMELGASGTYLSVLLALREGVIFEFKDPNLEARVMIVSKDFALSGKLSELIIKYESFLDNLKVMPGDYIEVSN